MSRIWPVRMALLGLALLSIAGLVSAQTKLAVVNLQRAVLESEEIKKASAALEAKYKPRQAEMQKIEAELQGIQDNLQKNAGKLTQQGQADLTAQGQSRQRELQRLTEDLQADVDRERNDILSKSSKQMQGVVAKLALDKGYDVVVDVTNTIYFKPALDVTSEALAEYNKAFPAK
ncbi:MAG: OmpH family outer membrane protein [Acidobacteriota bacterium]|nr:OmpH family outer membrane protein [Acidobacteriota bacterium]